MNGQLLQLSFSRYLVNAFFAESSCSSKSSTQGIETTLTFLPKLEISLLASMQRSARLIMPINIRSGISSQSETTYPPGQLFRSKYFLDLAYLVYLDKGQKVFSILNSAYKLHLFHFHLLV